MTILALLLCLIACGNAACLAVRHATPWPLVMLYWSIVGLYWAIKAILDTRR